VDPRAGMYTVCLCRESNPDYLISQCVGQSLHRLSFHVFEKYENIVGGYFCNRNLPGCIITRTYLSSRYSDGLEDTGF
jgi:hypothetical protein